MIKKVPVLFFAIIISVFNLQAKEYQQNEVKIDEKNFYTDIKTGKPITGIVNSVVNGYYITTNLETPVKDGLRDGVLKVYLGEIVIKEFPYKNGVLDGVYKKYSKRGILREEKIFKNGELIETIYYNEKQQVIYEPFGRTDVKYDENKTLVYVKDNTPVNGTLEIEYRGSISEKIDYKNGKMHGTKIDFSTSGEIKEKNSYVNGKLDGESIYYYNSGEIERKNHYKEGLRHGDFITYNKDGSIKRKAFFKNDLQEGADRSYRYDGTIWDEYFYKNGKKHGPHTRYNQLRKKVEIKVDEEQTKTTYLDEELDIKQNYKDGLLDGDAEYYRYGSLRRRGKYVNGEEEGRWYQYYSNGQTEFEGNYINGKKDGKWFEYDTDGKLISETNYLKGKKI